MIRPVRTGFPSDILEKCADPQRAAAALEQLRASDAGAAVRKLSAGQARIDGDVALGRSVLESMAFMI